MPPDMSKANASKPRKLQLDKRRVRKLVDRDLSDVAGGNTLPPPPQNGGGGECPSGNRCCANHNQRLRGR